MTWRCLSFILLPNRHVKSLFFFFFFFILQLFDIDEDGSITEDEFAQIIRSSLGLPDLDVSNLFKEIDADHSNKLSYGKEAEWELRKSRFGGTVGRRLWGVM